NLPLALIGGAVGVYLQEGVLSVASLVGSIVDLTLFRTACAIRGSDPPTLTFGRVRALARKSSVIAGPFTVCLS
ncbi:MAG: hypothetical protein RJA70_2511, partial [Pseudomonadota bacterium]